MSRAPQAVTAKPFLRLITAEEAYGHLARVASLPSESVKVVDAVGRVLAGEVRARDDVPHFFRSNMDGYAVRAADTERASESSSVRLRVAGQVAMGEEARDALQAGTAVRVSTGAMMPPEADAVVIVEHTEETGDGSVLVRHAVLPRDNTIAIGEDMRHGDLVFRPGHRVRAGDVGALCGVGRTQVDVFRRPRVAVMATGDEIVEPDQTLRPGQVRNINQYLLGAMARRLGAVIDDYGVLADREEVLRPALERAAATCDAVFISGGSSMGTRDLTLDTIGRLPGGEIVFHGIAIAPGKPTILARTPSCSILGVPGNPAAAAVVFTLFGATLVRLIEGEPLERILLTRPQCRAMLTERLASTPGREDYVRVRLESGAPLPRAVPVRGKSVAISTIARADGLLRIPLSTEGFEAGVEVDVLLFG